MSEDRSWAYNVSKKIAQLTKVVFRLYSENADRKNLVASVKQRYESELQAIRDLTEQKLIDSENSLRERELEYQKQLEIEYNSKFTEKCARLEDERIELAARAANYEQELVALRNEVVQLQQTISASIAQFSEAADKCRELNESSLASIREKFQGESDALVKLTQQKCETLNERNRELARQIEELKRQPQMDPEREKEIERLNSEVKSLTEKIEKQGATAKKKVAELTKANQILKDNVKAMKDKAGTGDARIEELTKKTQDLQNKQCELERRNHDLQEHLNREKARVLELEMNLNQNHESDQKHVTLVLSGDVFVVERFGNEDVLRNRTKELELKLMEKGKHLKEAKQRADAAVGDVARMKELMETQTLEWEKKFQVFQRDTIIPKDKKIDELTQIIQKINAEMDATVARHQREMENIHAEHMKMRDQISREKDAQHSEINELQNNIGQLELSLKNEKRKRRSLQARMQELIASHSDELEKSKSEYEQLLTEKNSVIEKLAEELKSANESDEKKRIKQLERQVSERTEALVKVYAELKQYRAELVNRETTYNKMFSKEPDVAVLNVLERRMQRDSIRGMLWNLPPLEKEEPKTSRRRKKVRVMCDQ